MQSHDQSHAQHPRSPEEHLLAVHKALGAREVVDVDIEQAVGCRLARSVNARVDSPSFDNSQMDGYALGHHHLRGGNFEVGETIAAGVDPSAPYPQGIGAEIVAEAATGDRFSHANGRYFDNDSGAFAPPHPDASDAAKTAAVCAAIDALIAPHLSQKI